MPQNGLTITALALCALAPIVIVGCRAQAAPSAPPTISAQTAAATSATEHFSHVTFAPPAGWIRAEAGGWVIFTPPDLAPGQAVAIEVSPGGESSRDLAEEFAALVKVSANGMTAVESRDAHVTTDRQGLRTIQQSVVLQDANGVKYARLYVARRNGGRFKSAMFTANSQDLITKYASAMKSFVGSMIFDGAPAPRPDVEAAAPAVARPYPPAAHVQASARPSISQPAPTNAVRLSPMAARPNYITGRVVFENGQPVPKFHIKMAGMSGKFDPLFNNHLGGPQVSETATSHGQTDGANGQYSFRATEDATVTGVYATATVHFDGVDWGITAWPTDNIADGASLVTADLFRGHTGKGIVRDFVLKMSGIRNGYDPAQYPDHAAGSRDWGAYYGGTIFFGCGADNTGNTGGVYGITHAKPVLTAAYPANSIVTVTFTPSGLRADGLPASTITRKCPLSPNFILFGIPYAIYTATATITDPSGGVHNLKLTAQPLAAQPTWGSSANVRWAPWANREPTLLSMGIAAE